MNRSYYRSYEAPAGGLTEIRHANAGEGTPIDAYLASAALIGIVLHTIVGWWWADPLAALVLPFYVRDPVAAGRESARDTQ